MAYYLAPSADARPQFLTNQGAVLNGGFMYWYAAGTTTPQDTFTDSTGGTPNANPIALDAAGRPPTGIYLTENTLYKLIVKDSAGNTIFTQDNVAGIIASIASTTEWQSSGLTPTYISATQFSVPGDQTTALHVGRRVKIADAGGTKYGYIEASAFTTLTTITVALDSSTLASPVSTVSYGLLSADNPSVPTFKTAVRFAGVVSPTQISANQDNYNPTSLAAANTLRISTDARRSITGLAGGASGRMLVVHNVGTFPAVFKYEDANSTAANRFAFGCTLGGGQTLELIYDATTARWRCRSKPDPLGTIKDFGTSTLAEDHLAIDQNVSRTTYASLFNEIGTIWGTGDGSTTFGLFIGMGRTRVAAGTGTVSESVAFGSVSTGSDNFTVTSNNKKWITGQPVVLTTTGGLPAPLATVTTYYLVRASATLIQFATTLANAQNGTVIDITTQGTGTHTVTGTLTARTHGEIGGEEDHAQSITELLAHTHTKSDFLINSPPGDTWAAGATGTHSAAATGSKGGNAAMNVMQPFAVVTVGIKYC